MNYRKKTFFFIVSAFLLSILSTSSALGFTIIADDQTVTPSQCTTPTKTLYVGVIIGSMAFNVTSLNAPKNSCVEIVFHNADPSMVHTFTINEDTANNITLFNIYSAGTESHSLNFLTPNADMSITYYCAVPGHYASGMKGTLKIGTDSSGSGSAPGFEVIPVFIGLFAMATLAVIIKKKN